MNIRTIAACCLALASAACSSEPEASPPKSSTAAPAAAKQENSAAATKTPSASAADTPAGTGPLTFKAQPGWTEEKPTSAMRKAQYVLPKSDKDTEDATLVVYFFSATAGSVQANLDRWTQQFEQPDGKTSADVLTNSERTVNGLRVHDVELSGTYVAETSPGSGQHLRKEGWRMLASIIEAKEGPYYAKLVGPSATVKHWEPSFRNFVSEAKPGK
jgi:hypothetical protein